MLTQLRTMSLWDVVRTLLDISIVAYVLYRLLLLIRGTRAVQLIKGLTVVLIFSWASRMLNLGAVNYLLRNATVALAVALPIVFQPELRRALEQLGRAGFFVRTVAVLEEQDLERVIKEIVRAVEVLSRNKSGALIVLVRQTGLKEIADTGTAIDGRVSAELIVNIFMPHTPLEDGALLIRGERVVAAGCFLPLSENPDLDRDLGARHRAAIGLTEDSDAVVVVVSEETGAVSLANGGKLIRHLDQETLAEMLAGLTSRPGTATSWLRSAEH